MKTNRRKFLQSITALAASTYCPRLILASPKQSEVDYILIAKEASVNLMPDSLASALTYNGNIPAPIIRAKQGQRIRIKLINQLKTQSTTIHWHGLRIPNAMDGVPFISHPPIEPGQSFIYDFIPPDAGTFWYHPHINSLPQMARGMVGLFIVDEKEPLAFAADIPLTLKKWRLTTKGAFKAQQFVARKAARHGTKGNWQTINGKAQPSINIPAGGAIRLRFANLDNSMYYNIHIDQPQVKMLAFDGMPLTPPRPQTHYQLGAGMRLDLGFIAPVKPGVEITVLNKNAMGDEVLLTLKTVPSKLPATTQLPRLPANLIPPPDLASAETKYFTFDWDAAISPKNQKPGHLPIFWSINQQSLTEMMMGNLGEPLVRLSLGKSYIFSLKNTSQYHHPIHLHGFSFTVLESDKRTIIPYIADTVMLGKNEKIKVAFVADNPGKWMFHCHVIDHMETGLMGYIEVS